jgi:hypothetical protein
MITHTIQPENVKRFDEDFETIEDIEREEP